MTASAKKAQPAKKPATSGKKTITAGKKSPAAVKKPPRRKLWPWLLSTVSVVILALVAAFYWQLQSLERYVVSAQDKPFALTAGMRARTVVTSLTQDKFNPLVVWAYVKLHEKEFSAIQKGAYIVDGKSTVTDLLTRMARGEVFMPKPFTVALVEGMNIEQLKIRLQKSAHLNFDADACFLHSADFMQEVLSKEQLDFLGGPKDSLEGLLMPATYPYYQDDSAKALLTQALRAMVDFLQQEWPQRSVNKVLNDPYEALILASIVERESSLNSEKPLIAGVFCNRLKQGIRLQTDPAVMYGVAPDFRGPLRRSHLNKDSPYNTYTRAGLPPTPIAQPSKEAILAVLHPAATKALYFVAKSYDPQDGHNFAATLKEHNRNVAAYRKSVREYKQAQANNE